MSEVTILQIGQNDLQKMLDTAVERAVFAAARKSGETWGAKELAAHYGVSDATIRNWEAAGQLPKRIGKRWDRADVMKWDADRRANSGPTNRRKAA